jgi:transposase
VDANSTNRGRTNSICSGVTPPRLASARHAPKDWVMRAQIVASSWDGWTVPQIAERVGCSARTARAWIHRFNDEGLSGIGDRDRPGRPRRLTEEQRSRIVALVKMMPPGRLHHASFAERLVRSDETSAVAVWSLDTLTEAANAQGIIVARSQVRRILLAEGARWRRVARGRCRRTPSSSQKDSRHRPLHPHARRHHGRLRR